MSQVQIIDRSEMIQTLNNRMVINPNTTAIVTIDMHRGHLDPSIATMPCSPEDCKRVITYAKSLLEFARSIGIPIVHVILIQRVIKNFGAEGLNLKFWKALHEIADEKNRLTPGRKSTAADHNLLGSAGTQIIPELLDPEDYITHVPDSRPKKQ